MRKTAIHLVAIGTVFLAVAGCNRAERRAHDVFGGTEHQARQVDINTASRKDLARLPSLTDDDADRIIANRPYGSARGLVNKKVLDEKKYDQIRDYVYASQAGRRMGGD